MEGKKIDLERFNDDKIYTSYMKIIVIKIIELRNKLQGVQSLSISDMYYIADLIQIYIDTRIDAQNKVKQPIVDEISICEILKKSITRNPDMFETKDSNSDWFGTVDKDQLKVIFERFNEKAEMIMNKCNFLRRISKDYLSRNDLDVQIDPGFPQLVLQISPKSHKLLNHEGKVIFDDSTEPPIINKDVKVISALAARQKAKGKGENIERDVI